MRFYSTFFLLVQLTLTSARFSRNDYTEDDTIPIMVTNISPGGNSEDGKHYLYPVNYFDKTIDFCYADKFTNPDEEDEKKRIDFDNEEFKNASKIFKHDQLFNDHIYFGPRTIVSKFKSDTQCEQNCWRQYTTASAAKINKLIERDYRLNFYIDDMPIGKEYFDYNTNKFYVSNNVPIGYEDVNHVLHIYNHWQIIVYYANNGLNKYNIIKAVMQQRSAKRVKEFENQCQIYPPLSLRLKPNVENKVIFTYDLVWKEVSNEVSNHLHWYNRMDLYKHNLLNDKYDIIANFLFAGLALLITIYNSNVLGNINRSASAKSVKMEDAIETDADDLALLTSWYSLRNDVFRKPKNLVFFSNIIGFGAQLTFAVAVTLLLLLLNAISIIIPGDVKRTLFHLIVFGSVVHSYCSTRVYKSFHPAFFTTDSTEQGIFSHKKLILINTIFTPLIFLVVSLGLDHAYKSVDSSKLLHLENYSYIFFHKFLKLYVPLSLVSTLYVLKVTKINQVTQVNMIERKVPHTSIISELLNSVMVACFPFSIIAPKLNYLWYSILFNNFYFGVWNYLITLVISAWVLVMVNSVVVYYALNSGNWKWHWLTLYNSMTVGLLCFIYSFKIVDWNNFGDRASCLIFVCENLIISLIIGFSYSAVNFLYTFRFIKGLYV